MSEIRVLQRVAEEYIYDPYMDKHYHLKPVKKSGSDQDFIDAIKQAASELDQLDQTNKVYRPTVYLRKGTQFDSIAHEVLDWASENSYLMFFDPGCAEPSEIDIEPWAQEGNAIFIWSSDDVVYTWCNPDQIAHRFRRVDDLSEIPGLNEPEEPEDEPEDEEPEEPETSTTTGEDVTLHLECPHCGQRIF